MGVPHSLQFSIAVFTAMVAATLAPPVRRSIPRLAEVSLWAALIASCIFGVMSVNEPNARELTATVVWGMDQILHTAAGLLGAGVMAWLHAWLYSHRFAIADGMLLLLGADILAITLIRSWRSGRAWQPRVRLRDWIEVPRPVAARPQPVPAYALDDVNRKWAAAAARVTGRVESLTARAVKAVKGAAAARWGRGLVGFGPGHVVEIQALPNAQSSGWYGRMLPALPAPAPEDDRGSELSHRLAS